MNSWRYNRCYNWSWLFTNSGQFCFIFHYDIRSLGAWVLVTRFQSHLSFYQFFSTSSYFSIWILTLIPHWISSSQTTISTICQKSRRTLMISIPWFSFRREQLRSRWQEWLWKSTSTGRNLTGSPDSKIDLKLNLRAELNYLDVMICWS